MLEGDEGWVCSDHVNKQHLGQWHHQGTHSTYSIYWGTSKCLLLNSWALNGKDSKTCSLCTLYILHSIMEFVPDLLDLSFVLWTEDEPPPASMYLNIAGKEDHGQQAIFSPSPSRSLSSTCTFIEEYLINLQGNFGVYQSLIWNPQCQVVLWHVVIAYIITVLKLYIWDSSVGCDLVFDGLVKLTRQIRRSA